VLFTRTGKHKTPSIKASTVSNPKPTTQPSHMVRIFVLYERYMGSGITLHVGLGPIRGQLKAMPSVH
jgi:hypothetical protein